MEIVSSKIDNNFVKSPQSIIHIKHNITLVEYKTWLFLLTKFREYYERKIRPDENNQYSISKSEFDRVIGYKTSYEKTKDILESLRITSIVISYLNKGGEKSTQGIGFISTWKLEGGTIYFELPMFLQNAMKNLDSPNAMYLLLNFEFLNNFAGKFEAVLYLLCKDYAGVGCTPYFSIQAFREYMGLSETEFPEFKQLNHYVIKRPIDIINNVVPCDILVEPVYKKEGRKVVGLHFKVQRRNTFELTDSADLSDEGSVDIAFLKAKEKISAKLQERYLGLRKPEEIALCLERANEYGVQQEAAGKTVRYGALYRKAIEEGWHEAQILAMKNRNERTAKAKKAVEEKAAKEAEDKALAMEKAAEVDAALMVFAQLPAEKQDGLRDEYAKDLPPMLLRSFKKDAEQSKMHRSSFVDFLRKKKLV